MFKALELQADLCSCLKHLATPAQAQLASLIDSFQDFPFTTVAPQTCFVNAAHPAASPELPAAEVSKDRNPDRKDQSAAVPSAIPPFIDHL